MPSGRGSSGGGFRGGSFGGSSRGFSSSGRGRSLYTSRGGSSRFGSPFVIKHRTSSSLSLGRRPGKVEIFLDLPTVHSVIVAILAFLIMIFGMGACSMNDAVAEKEREFIYYQNMIERAEEDPRYLTEATILKVIPDNDTDKYLFIYRIYYYPYENSEDPELRDMFYSLDGYTLSVYTKEEAEAFEFGDKVQVAINRYPVDDYTDSIPTDYKDKTLDDDGDYVSFRKGEIATSVILGSLVGILAVWFVIFIILTNKAKKKFEEEKVKKQSSAYSVEKDKYCAYCGTYLGDKYARCPSCGAGVSVKTTKIS